MVNHYYWYIFDEDFGPFILKFGSYFPYNAKVCLNGHEWLKRQLAKEAIDYGQIGDQQRQRVGPHPDTANWIASVWH